MRSYFFALLLILFTLFVSIATSSLRTRGSQAEPPMVYYFSPAENGYVIEHADGSNGAIMASHVVPDDHTLIEGPGWSPSGKWFAWTSAFKNWDPNAYKSFPWIINREGTRCLTLLDGTAAYGVSLQWSPNTDLLLATIPYSDPFLESAYIQLIDPNTERILFTYERASQSVWSMSGKYFFFTQDSDPDTSKYAPMLVVASLDGILFQRPIERFGPTPEYRWTPDDRLLYLESGSQHLIFETVETQQRTYISLPATFLKHIDWSPDGRRVLIYTGTPDKSRLATQLWSFAVNLYDFRACETQNAVKLRDTFPI